MRIAIFSDLHDNLEAFYRLLEEATTQRVDRFIYLGDVGRDVRIFQQLQVRQIPCTYGNWEVSGLRYLHGTLHDWVADWPGTIHEGEAIYCHATPDLPPEAATTRTASQTMQRGVGWMRLFPRLHSNEDARWQAFAALEAQDMRVAFHGHTHVQLAWSWAMSESGTRRLRSLSVGAIELTPGNPQQPNRYLIGVGSAGQPNDGDQGKYAIYDETLGVVELRSLR
ncbi:MAG: metallophosphoesterase family protein [Caldilineaceae bacterium]